MIKCACGSKDCKTGIFFGHSSLSNGAIDLFFRDADGREHLMYLDANTTIELIHALKKELLALADYLELEGDE